MNNMLMVELNEDTLVTMDGKDYAVVPVDHKPKESGIAANAGLLCIIGYLAVKTFMGLAGLPMILMLGFCGFMGFVVARDLVKAIDRALKARAEKKAQEPKKDELQKAS